MKKRKWEENEAWTLNVVEIGVAVRTQPNA